MQLWSRNKILELDTPKIMAILNYTSDSFYDGGKYNTFEKFMQRAHECIQDGADILDIGVASTRPGALLINPEKEWEILKPLLTEIRTSYPDTFISIDTYNSYTAEKCIEYGADIINDVSGGTFDHKMFDVISQSKIAYVLMHTSDIPEKMQQNTNYQDVVDDVKLFLKKRIEILHHRGFGNIIIDPGFGFGKTLEQNYELLKRLDEFKELNYPILVGISRKSMIYKLLQVKAESEETLYGTLVLNALAIAKGARIIRVHDVKASVYLQKMILKVI